MSRVRLPVYTGWVESPTSTAFGRVSSKVLSMRVWLCIGRSQSASNRSRKQAARLAPHSVLRTGAG
ncbi:hypothetical protein D3C72_2162000 [compost metagenome]